VSAAWARGSCRAHQHLMIWLRLLYRAFHAVACCTPPSLLEPTMYQLKRSRSFVHSLVTLATPRPLFSFISHILYSVMSAVLLYSCHCQPLPICAWSRSVPQYHCLIRRTVTVRE